MESDLFKFKHVLEYFVAHLNYLQSNYSETVVGFEKYIKPFLDENDFTYTGQGYNDGKIQKQISNWENISNHRLCVNVQPQYGKKYKSKRCYLNWIGTGLNVFSNWNKDEVSSLSVGYAYWWMKPTGYKIVMTKTLKELNLFNENGDDSSLKEFFDLFVKEIDDYDKKISSYYLAAQKHYEQENQIQIMKATEQYIKLLKTNHNVILTGAPGTGKTYLAKQIAQQMILGKVTDKLAENEQKQFDEQCGFVQFHPSYDYTDFIEGLRPKQYSGGNIGFEIKDGVFKKFCTKAIKDTYSDSTDNFEEVWRNFVKDLSVSGIQIPTTTGNGKPFTVVLNQNGDGLVDVQSTYNRYYNYEQLYNVYRGLPGVPNGGHDNYRQAVIKYLKKEYRLKDYKIGKKTDTDKKFIFIIDEINRGEISKIFGELFFSIDPGYRGKNGEVKTQYANMYETPNEFDNELGITDTHDYGHFFVPKNVYIIGTMNDIDRSVESMDFAFRRRFAFKEIKAKETQYMLDSEEAWGKDNNNKSLKPKDDVVQKVKNRMNNLNDMIWHEPIENESNDIKSIEGFSSAYHIGASYFLKLANYKNDDGSYDFDKLWDYHLDGLLHEYLRGMDDVDNKIDRLKQAYKNDNA